MEYEFEEETKARDPTAEYRRQEHLKDIKALIGSSSGRRVFWEILNWCNLSGPSFSLNPLEMAKNEGCRSIGMKLLKDISTVDPDGYVKILEERKKTLAEEAAIKEVANNEY